MVNLHTTILVFNPQNVGDIVEFPHRAKVGISMFLLSDPIFDNDFLPKNHWKMLKDLLDPDTNV